MAFHAISMRGVGLELVVPCPCSLPRPQQPPWTLVIPLKTLYTQSFACRNCMRPSVSRGWRIIAGPVPKPPPESPAAGPSEFLEERDLKDGVEDVMLPFPLVQRTGVHGPSGVVGHSPRRHDEMVGRVDLGTWDAGRGADIGQHGDRHWDGGSMRACMQM